MAKGHPATLGAALPSIPSATRPARRPRKLASRANLAKHDASGRWQADKKKGSNALAGRFGPTDRNGDPAHPGSHRARGGRQPLQLRGQQSHQFR